MSTIKLNSNDVLQFVVSDTNYVLKNKENFEQNSLIKDFLNVVENNPNYVLECINNVTDNKNLN